MFKPFLVVATFVAASPALASGISGKWAVDVGLCHENHLTTDGLLKFSRSKLEMVESGCRITNRATYEGVETINALCEWAMEDPKWSVDVEVNKDDKQASIRIADGDWQTYQRCP